MKSSNPLIIFFIVLNFFVSLLYLSSAYGYCDVCDKEACNCAVEREGRIIELISIQTPQEMTARIYLAVLEPLEVTELRSLLSMLQNYLSFFDQHREPIDLIEEINKLSDNKMKELQRKFQKYSKGQRFQIKNFKPL